MAKRRGRHLYRGRGTKTRERRAFEREYESRGYSKQRADRIYGATVGKVRREREAKRKGGKMARESHTHRHSRGHHRGRCSPMDRRGMAPHYHRRRRHHRSHARRR
jgi:hypothetical protein